MSTLHQFGGDWTEEKLIRLKKYLSAYMKIFHKNPWAAKYTTYYVDAFAGTGSRIETKAESNSTLSLFEEVDAVDVKRFYKGSAKIALEVEPTFDRFIFIEQNPSYVQELEKLRFEYPSKATQITIEQNNANDFLQRWCQNTNWSNSRAVIFLDPYGMAVDWVTLEAIAQTKAIDLWILLPVGQAINRLLTRQGLPSDAWADKLTKFFGSEEWKDAFYQPRTQPTLFDLGKNFEKKANFESIGDFFAKRLETIFEKVAENSLVLLNSRNVPIFVLYFAASNPRGAPTAVKIAGDILGR